MNRRHGPITHGHTSRSGASPEYRSWLSMRTRCTNPNYRHFDRYGGRGISVCPRWFFSFENFFADMGPRPGPGYSVERENNDGDYEPSNCIWAPASVQARNKHNNHIVEIDGMRLCLMDAAKAFGLDYRTVNGRLRAGWPTDRAFKTPARAYHPRSASR